MSRHRQLEAEHRATAGPPLHPQLGTVAPHDAPAEVQTEANARHLVTLPAPAELLEDPRHVVRVDARAPVGDLYLDPPLLADHPQLDGRALGRIFGCIREQVAQDLPDALGEGDTRFQAIADAKARAELMPRGRFEVVAGEHSPWLDDPTACAGGMATLYTH